MRRALVILLLIFTTLLLASCTPPAPPPTYTIFVDDGVLVFSGTPYDLDVNENRFVIPKYAIEAYALGDYNFTTNSYDELHRFEHGSAIPVNGSYHLVRILFAWNGTLPNVTSRETALYVANAPGAVRISSEKSRIATNVAQADLETLVTTSSYLHYRELGSINDGPQPAYLGTTHATTIELEQAPSRWQLIRPREYLTSTLSLLALLALISAPAILATRLPEHRFLLYGPLAFGVVGITYHFLAFVLITTAFWSRLFGTVSTTALIIGAFIGFLVGPLVTWKRFEAKRALLSALISIGWIPAFHLALYILSLVLMFVLSLASLI